MPYYAIFATPLRQSFFIEPENEYTAELDAETDEEAIDEAESEFKPFLLAVHYYPSGEKDLDGSRTVIDYEKEEKRRLREEEEREEAEAAAEDAALGIFDDED